MKKPFLNVVLAAALLASPFSISLGLADPMADAQKKDIEKIVHDYLVANPEVLIEASQVLQQKQQKSLQEQAQSVIFKEAPALLNDKLTQTGNPNGKVTLVEFFDYQCVHCKKMSPVLNELTAKNKDLRIVYKEFPIFGKSSDFASKAALAAAMQGKYQAMHDALLAQQKRLNDDLVLKVAESLHLDMTKFKADMDGATVKDALEANRTLAEKMHLMGTPAFIVMTNQGNQIKSGTQPAFVPGAASQETLQDLIKTASSA